MEALIANLLEPGETIIVGNNGAKTLTHGRRGCSVHPFLTPPSGLWIVSSLSEELRSAA